MRRGEVSYSQGRGFDPDECQFFSEFILEIYYYSS